MTTTDFRVGHGWSDPHRISAGPGLDPRNELELDEEQATRTAHLVRNAHPGFAGAGTDSRHAMDVPSSNTAARGGHDSAATKFAVEAREVPSLPPDSPNGHASLADQNGSAVGGTNTADPAKDHAIPNGRTPGSAGEQGQPARERTTTTNVSLADPTLALAADVLDDLERTRIANENRLRQLTRDEPDEDGEIRGFGLTEDHPDVARLANIVDGLTKLEHEATLNLARAMRKHQLGPWVKGQKGVGEKQAARLLAAIGDPYWNYLHDRPRTVSELWAYCGLHTLPAGRTRADTHSTRASGGNVPSSDQTPSDSHGLNVAARRKKGQRANWSTTAKMRAWNIAGSMLKAGNRDVYDKRKAATEGRTHATECVRCGPSGKPAQPGTPWSDAHRHADALRIVSKWLLKELWRAARDIHLGHRSSDDHCMAAEVEHALETDNH